MMNGSPWSSPTTPLMTGLTKVAEAPTAEVLRHRAWVFRGQRSRENVHGPSHRPARPIWEVLCHDGLRRRLPFPPSLGLGVAATTASAQPLRAVEPSLLRGGGG